MNKYKLSNLYKCKLKHVKYYIKYINYILNKKHFPHKIRQLNVKVYKIYKKKLH